jgi:hypothetical protein
VPHCDAIPGMPPHPVADGVSQLAAKCHQPSTGTGPSVVASQCMRRCRGGVPRVPADCVTILRCGGMVAAGRRQLEVSNGDSEPGSRTPTEISILLLIPSTSQPDPNCAATMHMIVGATSVLTNARSGPSTVQNSG